MRIATPCHEDWNAMTPVAGGRHCASCAQPVVDLSDLEPTARRARLAEIERTVAAGTRVCVRGRVDRDGALSGTRRLLTGGMAALLAMSLAGACGDGLQAAETPTTPTTTQSPPPVTPIPVPVATDPVLMGKMRGADQVPVQPPVQAPEPPPPRLMGAICVTPPPKNPPAK